MSQWVRTDYEIDVPMVILCIHDREARSLGLNLPGLMKDSPEVIEKIVYDMLAEVRPDLDGCSLIAIRYVLPKWRWEFTVIYRSFPRLQMGSTPPYQSLLPDEDF